MFAVPLADARLAALRAEVRKLERAGSAGAERPCLGLGIREVDERLAGGGLVGALSGVGEDIEPSLLPCASIRSLRAENSAACGCVSSNSRPRANSVG